MGKFFMERNLHWEDSPQKKKCVSLGNPFFVGHANLASHAKKNKDLQQKISSQWNFRPP